MALLYFLKNHHNVTVAHYVHDSEYAEIEYQFVSKVCVDLDIPMIVGHQTPEFQPGMSREAYWREGRYKFFNSIDGEIAVGANLDDAVEWYLLSCLRGEGHFMNYRNCNVVRPFLTTEKAELIKYATDHQIPWIEDPGNHNVESGRRTKIRMTLVPAALGVEPGLKELVKKRIIEKTRTNNGQDSVFN